MHAAHSPHESAPGAALGASSPIMSVAPGSIPSADQATIASLPIPKAKVGASDGERTKNWFGRHARRLRLFGIWVGFFGLLYFFRSFISLVFITFIMSYVMNSLINYLCGRLPEWPRGGVIFLAYSILGLAVVGMGMIVIPKVYHEGKIFSVEFPIAKEKLLNAIRPYTQDSDYSKIIEGAGLEEAIRERFGDLVQSFSLFLQALFRTSFHFILSMIFSFLILWDSDRLARDTQGLETTRLGYIYRALAPSLTQFGSILGKAFEAQIIIAWANTILTLIGLTFLGVPSKLFLSVFVFICSFIPVLGVIISSVPICLLAYKEEGLFLVFYSGCLIAVIHFIEAYILNPRIVGAHLALHPFVAVCILVLSENLFGVWGLLLGVPGAVFLYNVLVWVPPAPPRRKDILLDEKKVPVAT